VLGVTERERQMCVVLRRWGASVEIPPRDGGGLAHWPCRQGGRCWVNRLSTLRWVYIVCGEPRICAVPDRPEPSHHLDATIRAWDASTGAERRVLQGRCSHHIFATRSWIPDNGEELLFLHPDYRDSFGIVSRSLVISTGQVSHAGSRTRKRE